MKAWAILTALCVVAGVTRAPAQSAQLVRCTAGADVACLKIETLGRLNELSGTTTLNRQPMRVIGARSNDSTTTLYMLVPTGSVDRLGRVAMRGVIHLSAGNGIQWQWKPPLVAQLGFTGVADSLAFPAGVRQALGTGSSYLTGRLMFAATLLLLVLATLVSLPKLTWGDPAPVAMARRTSAPTATVDMAVLERRPRSPDDITLQTARRTALDR